MAGLSTRAFDQRCCQNSERRGTYNKAHAAADAASEALEQSIQLDSASQTLRRLTVNDVCDQGDHRPVGGQIANAVRVHCSSREAFGQAGCHQAACLRLLGAVQATAANRSQGFFGPSDGQPWGRI